MSLASKTSSIVARNPLSDLPELPDLPSLAVTDRSTLAEFWRQVREVLLRNDASVRASSTQAQQQPQGAQSSPAASGSSDSVTHSEMGVAIQQAIADSKFTFIQGTPSKEWRIVHSLGFNPSATVIDSMGNVVFGEEIHVSTSEMIVKFNSGFSGKAYLV